MAGEVYVIKDAWRAPNPTPSIGPADVTFVLYHLANHGLRTIRINEPAPNLATVVAAIRADVAFRAIFAGQTGTI